MRARFLKSEGNWRFDISNISTCVCPLLSLKFAKYAKMNISKMIEIIYIYKYDREEIQTTNRYIREHIDSCHKESERHAAYTEQSTANLKTLQTLPLIAPV